MEVFGLALSTWALVVLPLSLATYELCWIIYCRTLHPLSHIPSDFWPSVSRTWLMYQMHSGHLEEGERRLHAKYGPLVRVAPNEVSACEASAIPKVYRTQKPLPKSDYYSFYRPIGISDRPDTFTNMDEVDHTAHRKIVNPVYTMTSVLKSEAAIDNCLNWFVKRLGEYADNGKILDLGHCIEMYTYDIVGVVFFGKPLGMLERGYDHLEYIENVWTCLPLLGLAAVAPTYIRNALMTTAVMLRPSNMRAVQGSANIRTAALEYTERRREDLEEKDTGKDDLLSQLFRIVKSRKDPTFQDKEVALEAWVGIIAGSDSTAVAIRAIFYQLMKYPPHFAKVLEEIDEADRAGKLSRPVRNSEGVNLKYTCATVKEALRISPPWQVHMPRMTPAQGLEVSGQYLPGGYRIGVNPALCQFDKAVFGQDADDFRPSRWLESAEKSFAMEKAILHFGGGTRTCIGKNIALVELNKTIPEVLRHFTFEMSHSRGWKTTTVGFVLQKDVTVNIKRRKQG